MTFVGGRRTEKTGIFTFPYVYLGYKGDCPSNNSHGDIKTL